MSGIYKSHSEMEPSEPKIMQLFKSERKRIRDATKNGKMKAEDLPKPEVKPIDDVDYVDHLLSFSDELKAAKLPEVRYLPANFEINFPHGSKFCLVALAFTDGFSDLNDLEKDGRIEEFMNKQAFLKWLTVNNLTYHFGDTIAYYFDLLPKMVKKDISEGGCTFDLNYPEPYGSPGNKSWLLEQIQKALDNLKKMV